MSDHDPIESLNYTQSLRRRFIDDLTKDDRLPTEKDDRVLFLQTLRDMDSATIGRVRNEIEQQNADSNSLIQHVVAEVMKRQPYGLRQHPITDITPIAPEVDKLPPVDDKDVDEEGYIGLVKGSSRDFLRRMDEKKP